MKRTMAFVMMIVFAATLGTAYAADRSGGLYNGITYFDLGPASPTGEVVLTQEAAAAPYNGITIFDLGRSEAPKRAYAATGSAAGGRAPEQKLYNGVTVF